MALAGPLGVLPGGGGGKVGWVHGDQVELPVAQLPGGGGHIQTMEADKLAVSLRGQAGQGKLPLVHVHACEGAAVEGVGVQGDDAVAGAQIHGPLGGFRLKKMDQMDRVLGEPAQGLVLIDAEMLVLEALPAHINTDR